MRKIMILFLMVIFALAGCSTIDELPPLAGDSSLSTSTQPEFEKPAEVVRKMAQFSPNDQFDFPPLTEVEKERKSNLNPFKLFFGKSKEKAIRDRRRFQAQTMKSERAMSFVEQIKAEKLPLRVDLRKYDTPVRNQNNGRCTAFGGAAVMENFLCRTYGICNEWLSTEDVWDGYEEYSVHSFIEATSQRKVCDEKYYPKAGKRQTPCRKTAHAKLVQTPFIASDVMKAVRSLAKGRPVYIGMETPQDMLRCYKFVSPYTEGSSGGHALAIVGYYVDEKVAGQVVFILKNSWGEDCGDGGYQYVALGHICTERRDMYCTMYSIESVKSDKSDVVIDPEDPSDPVVTPVVPTYEQFCKRNPWTLWLFYRCWWDCVANCE